MAERHLLHVKHLEAFIEFCKADGWKRENVKGGVGTYEVLRMRKDKLVLIVHGKGSTTAGNPLVHFSTWGESQKMVTKFLRAKRNGQSNPAA